MGLLSKAATKTVESGASGEDIKRKLKKFFESSVSIQGFVLEAPPGFKKKKGGEDFGALITRIITFLGSVLPLPSGRVLVILSDTADRELTAHQLEKNIKAKVLVVFAAEEPSKVLEYIGPYL
jgi:hypothetical protein